MHMARATHSIISLIASLLVVRGVVTFKFLFSLTRQYPAAAEAGR